MVYYGILWGGGYIIVYYGMLWYIIVYYSIFKQERDSQLKLQIEESRRKIANAPGRQNSLRRALEERGFNLRISGLVSRELPISVNRCVSTWTCCGSFCGLCVSVCVCVWGGGGGGGRGQICLCAVPRLVTWYVSPGTTHDLWRSSKLLCKGHPDGREEFAAGWANSIPNDLYNAKPLTPET